MDKAHGNRLHPQFDEPFHLRPGVLDIQCCDRVAVHPDSFDDLQTPRAFNQRRRFLPGHVVKLWNTQSSQLEDIGEPGRGQQTREGALSFENGIGRHGASMHHIARVIRFEIVRLDDFVNPLNHPFAEVLRSGQQFVGINITASARNDDIGKRAPHINTDS